MRQSQVAHEKTIEQIGRGCCAMKHVIPRVESSLPTSSKDQASATGCEALSMQI